MAMGMRARAIGCLMVLCAWGGTAQAQDSSAMEGLSGCVAGAASDADRSALVRWLFVALSAHPDLKSMGRIEEGQREQVDRAMAALMQRLITQDCAQHVRKLEIGQMQSAFEVAFKGLGEQAGLAAMMHPDVVAANANMTRYLDPEAFQRIFIKGAP